LTHSDRQTAKVTDVAEVPTKGRGTGGVRITKFKDEKRLDFGYVGPEAGLQLNRRCRGRSLEARPEPRNR